MEIRRGTMTFGSHKHTERSIWSSLDAWKASWPTGASPCAASAAPSAPRHPIIDRYLRGRQSNMYRVPSPEQIEFIKCQEGWAKERVAECQNKPEVARSAAHWQKQVDAATQRLRNYEEFQHGRYDYNPTITGNSYTFVKHGDRLLQVFHNRLENIVYICDNSNGFKFYTPEQLGITADSQFYRNKNFLVAI